jgi:hypothetical protein
MENRTARVDAEIKALGDTLIGEIFQAIGFAKTGLASRRLGGIFRKPADRLAFIGATADRMIAAQGFPAACAWMMSHWVKEVITAGAETVPQEGPLLVISNHCGAYDFLVIPAQLNRKDIAIIASNIPFLKNLPNACQHLFFTTDKASDRMLAARRGMQHLRGGGALLLFGTGLIDPDPAVYPDADKHIENWSPSIDLFLRAVPESQVLISIASGILSSRWAYHPITQLRRIDWQKRRLAEFGQVIEQLLFPGKLYVSPRVSFAPPASTEVLRIESQGNRLLPAVIARGKALLARHQAWIKEPDPRQAGSN